MSPEIAEYVRTLRLGSPQHTWRRISELVCDKYPDWFRAEYAYEGGHKDGWDMRGNQLVGKDLCEMASGVLGVSETDYASHWL